MKDKKPTIYELRQRLTPFQKELLQEIWEHYKSTADWPVLRKLYSKYSRQKVKSSLSPLGGNVGREERGPTRWTKYQLFLIGVLLTKDGIAYEKLLERFFEYQRELFRKSPLIDFVSGDDISKALGLSEEETVTLGRLLFVGNSGGSPQGKWGASVMDEAEHFPPAGDLSPQVEEWVLRYYHLNLPAFMDEQAAAQPQVLHFAGFTGSQVSTPTATSEQSHPPEIAMSLNRLRNQYPEQDKLGFLIMRFSKGKPFERIAEIVKRTANKYKLAVIRADDIQFHDDVFGNVRTLLHGCGFGIAIYERIETENNNANIGFEVGYLMAMNKPVLLLKDKNMRTLHSDLAGKLYKEFDPHEPDETIPDQLSAWLRDYGIAVSEQGGR